MKKEVVLFDEITKKEACFSLGGKIFEGDENLEIEFNKRLFAKAMIREEYEEKGFGHYDDYEEKFVVDIKHEQKFVFDCFFREQKIHVKEIVENDLP